MKQDADWVVIVTYREWLTWTTCGALRLGKGRRTRLSGRDYAPSSEAFGELMDKAPDVSRWEDQAYLVAYLRCTPPGCRSRKFTDLQLVTGFHPLSARGYALLKGDAERALVKLGGPMYEDRWRKWVDANRTVSLRPMTGFTAIAGSVIVTAPRHRSLLDASFPRRHDPPLAAPRATLA